MPKKSAAASPDVIVVIVNYRCAAFTARAVESLAAERERHPELNLRAVVVENASGDEPALRRLLGGRHEDWLTLLFSPVNGGFGSGNNFGMRWALGQGLSPRYFHFLNPDTEVRPGGVAQLVRFMDQHPSAGMAGSRLENDDGSGWPTAFRFPSVWSELEEGLTLGIVTRLLDRHVVRRVMSDQAALVDWLPGASCMVRRQMLEDLGGFDEAFFLYFEETDLALRARRAGWQAWYVPDSLVMHVAGQSTGVTVRTSKPPRLPRYWFESRRRFYSKNHGLGYAAAADLAFLFGHAVGTVKRKLRRQTHRPYLLRDFLRESASFHWRGRPVAPARTDLGAPAPQVQTAAPGQAQGHQRPKATT
jgi:N-acetylglucosaminyl-diphospho-decaprenol L-rhamnosyltransferase